MTPSPPPSGYTDDEFREFVAQLHRYCSVELDQWARWRLPTAYGDIYVTVHREIIDGSTPAHYDDLTRWLDSPVERVFAHVLRAVAPDDRGAEPES